MARKKQFKRHKSKRVPRQPPRQPPAPPDPPAPEHIVPRFLAEFSSDARRVAYWATRDQQHAQHGRTLVDDPQTLALARETIQHLLKSRNNRDRRAGIRALISLSRLGLQQSAQAIKYAGDVLGSHVATEVAKGELEQELDPRTPAGATQALQSRLRSQREQ